MTDDNDDGESQLVLTELEKIDDDCDRHGIQFVKIDDPKAAKEFGIDTTPSIVYFEKKIPNLYDGKYFRDLPSNHSPLQGHKSLRTF